jgi:hypothetical protein
MTLRKTALVAGVATACALVVIWPRTTCAEEIADADRAGEWSEEGEKFGEVVAKAELVADAKVPGGWVLVRTLANTSDEAQTVSLEERVVRRISLLDARVDGTPAVATATVRTFTLAAHEKQKIGVALPASLGAEISAGQRTRAAAERSRDWMSDDGVANPVKRAAYDRSFAVFSAEYLKPLPPGATAQRPDYVTGPGRMPAAPPPPPAVAMRGTK